MVRVPAIIGILLLLSILLLQRYYQQDRGELQLDAFYLVVDVEGPPDWRKENVFSVIWNEKTLPLPIAFKVAMVEDRPQFSMGSGGENFEHLKIGDCQVPVSVNPRIKFHVRNSPAFAIIDEKPSKRNTAEISFANLVIVCPPEFEDRHDLQAFSNDKLNAMEPRLEVRLKQLMDKGRLIEVTASD